MHSLLPPLQLNNNTTSSYTGSHNSIALQHVDPDDGLNNSVEIMSDDEVQIVEPTVEQLSAHLAAVRAESLRFHNLLEDIVAFVLDYQEGICTAHQALDAVNDVLHRM